MSDMKLYAVRDPEEQGEWFVRHMSAMTKENLHSKAEIAEELAHRDIRIEALEAEIKRLTISLAAAKGCVSQQHEDIAKLRAAVIEVARKVVDNDCSYYNVTYALEKALADLDRGENDET